MMESVYYNSGNIFIGQGKAFYNNAKRYIETEDYKHWEEALSIIKESYKKTRPKIREGLRKRRLAEVSMGSSAKRHYPLNLDRTPVHEKFITEINDRIVPKTRLGENCTKSDRYYIWRTCLDHKVRPNHMKNEGKIFDKDNPPSTGNPGEDYNCRCKADYYIPNYVEIDGQNEVKMVRKYFPSVKDIPGLVIKNSWDYKVTNYDH